MTERTLAIKRAVTKHVSPEYYEAAAAIAQPRHFPSPVNDPIWINSATDWFVESQTAMEVGPGRGEFAEAVVRKAGGLNRYYIVDMSQGMLNLVGERIRTVKTEVESVFVCADVDSDPLSEIPDHSLDRIIMTNAFQDINPSAALRTFRRILKPTGLFRANVLDREIREKFSTDDDFFDRETGYFYLTRHPPDEGEKGIEPIGYVTGKDGEKIPFYRMMKSYYRSELDAIFNECGFKIVSDAPLILPKEIWVNSAAAQGRCNNRRLELMDKSGRYQSSIEIIAKPVIN
jgi:ubiquinone/menaquinone biosynthesis C-methylase UbiE